MLMDNRSAYVNKLQGELHMAFPQYLGIFSKVTTNTSLTLLETYTSPDAFIEADKQEIVDVIKSTARFGLTYANNKYHAIIQAAISGVSAFISALSASMMLRCNPNSPSCPTENSLFPSSLFSGFSSFLDIQIWFFLPCSLLLFPV